MNQAFLLYCLRRYRGWEPEDLARRASISTPEYEDLEAGRSTLDPFLAQRLADLYIIPVEILLSLPLPPSAGGPVQITFEACHFHGKGAAGYVHHQFNHYNQEQMQQVLARIEALQQTVNGLQGKPTG
ncbi:MAG TPA: helix-turn-helix transcriptional regulator [Chitinophagaceae bacterium]|nr:helix-turn-helix transcriptional regulator [Chitinophagaceae bacterium]